jgi:predicted ATPase
MILTPDQRLRVFVSSTLLELAEERAAAREAIEALRLAPVMFELGARPHPPRALYQAYLAQSHVFLGIYWQQYGWIAPDMQISGLHDELLLATEQPRLLYVKEPAPDRDPRLAALIAGLEGQRGASYRVFRDAAELAELVAVDLAHLLSERFAAMEAGTETDPPRGRAAPLPRPTTSFVGRSTELAHLREELRRGDVRLVTLTGPGGIGKTRLALEVAEGLHNAFPDGVHFIPLSHVPRHELVLPAIANALGIRAEGLELQRSGIVEALGDRKALLILDNFEQVIEAAPHVGQLLVDCPGVTLLVTSRRVLRVRGEHEHHIGALALPPAGVADEAALLESAAAALFVERARAVRPDLVLSPREVAAVVELVRRLDGMPLAIELAAARARILSPSALVARLCGTLDLLDGGFEDLPARQRSLRATLDWSLELLDEAERRLFARLSTFVDGFTLRAAEAVCAESAGTGMVLDGLSALVESSLVSVSATQTDELRFHMLNPIREYARGLLEPQDKHEVDRHHTSFFLELTRRAGPALRGADQARWLERLERELGNISISARRCLTVGDLEPVAEASWHLWPWFWLGDHVAAAAYWSEMALQQREQISLLGRARIQWVHAACRYELGDHDTIGPLLAEAREWFEEAGDACGQAVADMLLGSLAAAAGRTEEAEERLRSSVAVLRDQGDRFSATVPAGSLGFLLARLERDPAEIDATFAQGLADAEAIGNQPMIMMNRLLHGLVWFLRGDVDAARAELLRVVEGTANLRSAEMLAYGLEGLAAVALGEDRVDHAATLLGAAAGLRSRTGLSPWPQFRPLLEDLRSAARALLPPETFEIAWAAGSALDRQGAGRLALGTLEREELAPSGP